jgi:nitrogen fixation NifU-like protein
MHTEKVMDHLRHPRNVGEIPDADGIGKVESPVCGDLLWIYIKVKDDRLEDIKFKIFSCGAAITTSSMITEMARGKTIDEALKISRADVANTLGGLPPIKMHCSNIASDGLKLAILDYMKKKGITPPEEIKIEPETEKKREWLQKLSYKKLKKNVKDMAKDMGGENKERSQKNEEVRGISD